MSIIRNDNGYRFFAAADAVAVASTSVLYVYILSIDLTSFSEHKTHAS